MKPFIYLITLTVLCACNNSNQKTETSHADTTSETENKNVETIIKNDSLKMMEKEKELLEKYK